MSFHRSCCCKGDCFPHGMAVSFLDIYHDTSPGGGGDDSCGDCPIEGGCNGSFIEDVEILEGQVDCRCEQYWDGQWQEAFCPYIPCSEWPGPGTFEFWHCGSSCVEYYPDLCEENGEEIERCNGKDCPCAMRYRLICEEDAESCKQGRIHQKCCSRLHVYYGAYHDGEKYWLSDNPMTYFSESEDPGVNCKRECGAATMSTAPACQGKGLVRCPDLKGCEDPGVSCRSCNCLRCNPVSCCDSEAGCGNCPYCATPEDAPFCCQSSPTVICDFYEQLQEGGSGVIEDWGEWCKLKYGEDCLLDFEPYYWKFCGIGGWGASGGDVHVDRMYTIDDDEDSPFFGERIPCSNIGDQPVCDNSALYDIYDLTEGGGGVDPFVPHVLILYANHVRVGTTDESKSSYVVKGWWVSCTSNDNIYNLPADSVPDCHCPDSPTSKIGACCELEQGCADLTESDCNELGGNWQGPDDKCIDNPC